MGCCCIGGKGGGPNILCCSDLLAGEIRSYNGERRFDILCPNSKDSNNIINQIQRFILTEVSDMLDLDEATDVI